MTRRARVAAETDRGRERREHLLSVALRAFAAEGFRGASTSRIAKAAGISESGLLHHYPSKRDLLFGVLQRQEQLSLRRAAEITAHGGTYCDWTIELARRHEADPTFIRLFIVLAGESTASDHPAHAWFRERYARVLRWWEEGFIQDRERGALPRHADPHLIARQVVAILDGAELQHLLADGELDIVAPLQAFLAAIRD